MSTHVFELGRHIKEEFEIDASVQDVVNVVYFTGGPTAGVNLLKLFTNETSLAAHHRGMERLSDNRIVTANEDAAEQISETLMEENNGEVFSATIEIAASTYDITTISLGDTVRFLGFTNFVNGLVLQVVGKTPTIDGIRLRLGKVQYKSTNNNARIIHELDQLQTLDNPNAPS